MLEDGLVRYLNELDYNPIALPRERFDPLTVLGGDEKKCLIALGDLSSLLVAGTALPTIIRDDTVSNINGRRSNELDANAGITLLGKLLQLFGGTGANASAKYRSAASIEIEMTGVTRDLVYPFDVRDVLDVKNFKPNSIAWFKRYDPLYLVTETLKSNGFAVVAYDGQNRVLDLGADAIHDELGAKAGLTVTKDVDGMLSYKGDKSLRFAFKALSMKITPDGTNVSIALDQPGLITKAVASLPATEFAAYELISPGELLDIGPGAPE